MLKFLFVSIDYSLVYVVCVLCVIFAIFKMRSLLLLLTIMPVSCFSVAGSLQPGKYEKNLRLF